MQLFFVYDTACCKEDDDPKDAVVFFYPVQACETQRYALCCQLVGIAQFSKSTFSSPSTVILNQGKFVFHRHENYLIVLGGNSDITCIALKKQLWYICRIFYFYHGSVANILENCGNNRDNFLEKMELIWTYCLNFSQCNENLTKLSFTAMPVSPLKQPYSISAKARHLLQMCQLSSSVIAGAVFCNNLMLSTQLMPELSSYLTFLFYSNAPSSVYDASSVHDLPPGVELKYVYLTNKELENVMNYNHKSVGNVFRVRHSWKSVKHRTAHCYSRSHNSGSEGDVDSGNYSEINRGRKQSLEIQKFDAMHHAFYSDPGKIDLCEKNMNSSSLSLVNTIDSKQGNVPETDESGIYSRREFCVHGASVVKSTKLKEKILSDNDEKFRDTYSEKGVCNKIVCDHEKRKELNDRHSDFLGYTELRKGQPHLTKYQNRSKERSLLKFPATNLICQRHSSQLALSFLSKEATKYAWKNSSCDFEFSCYLCTNGFKSICYHQSFKRWNSEIFASHFNNQGCSNIESMILKLKFLNLVDTHAPANHHSKNNKMQILRCRSNSECLQKIKFYDFPNQVTRKHFNFSQDSKPEVTNLNWNFKRRIPVSSFKKHRSSSTVHNNLNVSGSLRNQMDCPSSDNKLHKIILYTQRCGSSNLLLLLNNLWDEKVLNYLWNCGFSVLNELEQAVKKNIRDECETESSFHIIVYNKAQQILKDYPHSSSSLSMEKLQQDSILLHIHEDFMTNCNLCSISVLTSDKSIYAQHSKQHSVFYVQPEVSLRKFESLCNLNKKAFRRIENSTGIVLEN